MIRIFIFLLFVLLLGFGFAWFADRPGAVALEWQGNSYQTSLMVVLVAIVAIVALVMITWWLIRSVLDSPRLMRRFFARRKRDHGYQALTRGLIAANSGDAASARRYTRESLRLLGRGPLVDMLDAQALLLEGNRDEARSRFEAMLEDDDTRLVGLRGLYVEAERQGAREAARHYADEAHKLAPALSWAGNAKLKYASMDGDWAGALATLEANRSAGLISKAEAKRQRAVLLTAQAMAEEPAEPARAAKLAREAHKLAPDLVPTAVIGAKALMRNNDIGRAAGMIEAVWKKTPHPELADAYIHLRIGDSATDRLKRAKKLAAMKPHHTEGSFAIAQAAIDAHEWQLARDTMRGILAVSPSERACLTMADIEESEFGDRGRMRDWLSRAVRAPRDAAWTADGYVSEKWLPFSPVTGRIDAFEWKVPVEQIGGPGDAPLDAEAIDALLAPPPASSQPPEPDAVPAAPAPPTRSSPAEEKDDAGSAGRDEADAGMIVEDGDSAREPPVTIEAEAAGAGRAEPEDHQDPEGLQDEALPSEAGLKKANGAEPDGIAASEVDDTVDRTADQVDEPEEDAQPVSAFAQGRRPDDPGISEDEPEPEKRKRFGIF